ncbi:MAG TPA: molybdopterin oxidoreductase family protein [Actinomycetota bacterium]|nr:molybdopterin oxidoreductase family protein [Actinomycetota bacterium]
MGDVGSTGTIAEATRGTTLPLSTSATTHFRTCPLCEATCGLTIDMIDGSVAGIRGDDEDVFSRGFICPKGTAVKHLHEDPDRLRRPVTRDGDTFLETSWEEAFSRVEEGLNETIARFGRDSVAIYVGNPSVHSLSLTVMLPMLLKAFGTQNYYSAATVDQIPKHVSCGFMFGNPLLIPVPDIDRSDYLLVLGANPWVSNGSLATAPDFRGRLEAIQRRGGKVAVVDPRRSETAAGASEHIPIRPGTDAFFLLAIIETLFSEGLDSADLPEYIAGVEEVRRVCKGFTPEAVEGRTGIPAETTKRVARELAASPAASVYDRVGAHQQRFGTVVSWASDVVTAITGNLDRPGGKMFSTPAHGARDPAQPRGRGWDTGRFVSRVKGYPEAFGQLPVATLADEIETPGEGQVRALITIAGNPVLSTPNGSRLERAIAGLDHYIAIDPFVNETTCQADVILPPPSIFARGHYDFAFYGLSVRNIANYSPPITQPEGPDEWEILSRLSLIALGQGAGADPTIVAGMALASLVQKAVGPEGPLAGRDPETILAACDGSDPVARILDFRLRTGPFGDLFGVEPEALSLAKLKGLPHGIDLGPLVPRLPNALRTALGTVDLAPPKILDDVAHLRAELNASGNGLVLIGRRQLRSNNSWMHNVPSMVKGSNRCTLLMHPDDAGAKGITDGAIVRISSRAGEVEAPVEVTTDMMPGVVSLPHGWGHGRAGTRLRVAQEHAGVSANDLTDEQVIDPLSGNAVLNGVPVTVQVV